MHESVHYAGACMGLKLTKMGGFIGHSKYHDCSVCRAMRRTDRVRRIPQSVLRAGDAWASSWPRRAASLAAAIIQSAPMRGPLTFLHRGWICQVGF